MTRRLLPDGTLPVGAGLAVLGLAAYVHLAVAGHRLDPAGYSSLSVCWAIVFTAGLGLFMPIEQEISCHVATRRRLGHPTRPTLLRVGVLAALAAGLLAGLVLAAAGPLTDRLFGGATALPWATAAALVGLAGAHTSRGLLAGLGRFHRYGVQLGLDGALRIGLVGLVALAGADSPGWYAAVLALAPPAAALLTTPLRTRPPLTRQPLTRQPGPVAWSTLLPALGLLVVASLLAQLVANLGVITARLLAPAQAAVAGAVLSALVLVRIPLFVFAALQAPLLPGLSATLATGDHPAYRRLLGRGLAAVTLLGAAGGLLTVGFGPWLVRYLFDAPAVLGRADFGWLAAGTLAYLWALVLGQALLAAGRHRGQAVGWTAGTAALAAVTLLPAELAVPTRVGAGYTAGALVAATAMALLLRHVGPAAGQPVAPGPTPATAGNRRP
ncbi:polysaccharide biosynthesis protein [Solwaraspora sp. WMMD1047]|uniref:polysaccharide biosynthesis protein n=1 Tax=Solwaraspora sp. WMMD1047 TaxID=3016102 RepID=UPI0024165CA8|nr:polysaccharide biosynthesis protein [Solwaraspora sp. WMMD1047]MDG4831144.1 polysaccharide biosynthesis protein [Solwaraspora sp. WMMD1047]